MGFPLYVICCFSLAAFNTLSLCLTFVRLVCVLACLCLGLSCKGLSAPLGFHWLLLLPFCGIFNYNLFKTFLIPFFSFSSETPITLMLVHLILSKRSLRLSSAFFHLFYFILLFSSYFHHFIFQLTDPFFCFRYSAINFF